MNDPPLASRDIQKIYAAQALVTIGGLGLFLVPESWGFLPKAVAAVGATTGILWLMIAAKCPACGLKLVPYAIANKAANGWLEWLLHTTSCPKCGFSHEP
jgi:predicted RNA-binding Zn-ribbon protein involved in translation (DUF1610 family)